MTRSQQLIAWHQKYPPAVRHTQTAQRALSVIVSSPPPADEKRVVEAERRLAAIEAELHRRMA